MSEKESGATSSVEKLVESIAQDALNGRAMDTFKGVMGLLHDQALSLELTADQGDVIGLTTEQEGEHRFAAQSIRALNSAMLQAWRNTNPAKGSDAA